jgi:2-methylisocitrate lyase-like PEP mutase family enzyme
MDMTIMNGERQAAMAEAFRARHRAPPVLFLPNVWDALSARVFAAAGYEGLATSSAGVAWALGYPDGEIAPWADVVAATGRIVGVAAGLPVTADIEGGYAETPEIVGRHVADIIGAGAVGINLEDSRGGTIRVLDDATARLQAARQAADEQGVPIVINARCDILLLQHGAEEGRFDAAVERCRAYLAAGADCVYPFGLRDPDLIAAFAQAVGAPINVTGRPGMPGAAELQQLGVARITLASASTLVAMDAIRELAMNLRSSGDFESLDSSVHHPEAQKLFQLKG